MLKELFVSEVRVRILKLMLLNTKMSYHVRAIVRAVDAEINAVRRELDNLFEIGLVTRRQSSNRIYYTVNTTHPFFTELLSLVSKEEGLGKILLKNETKLGDIEYAMIATSFLRGRDSSALDVDLFIVGAPNRPLLEELIKVEEERLGKEINFTIMPIDEFRSRKRTHDQFVVRILTQGRSMIIGDESRFSSIM